MIRLINVCKKYMVKNQVTFEFKNLNVDFDNRGFVLVSGKSGSGKTSLLSLIGLLDTIDSGDIFFDKLNLVKFNSDYKSDFIKNNIGFVFQNYNLFPNLTVYENLKIVYELSNVEVDNNKILNLLRSLDIERYKDVNVSKLSGGEQQRVAIVRALINEPSIVLCDEPTGALDVENSVKIYELLKEISKERLVLVVSHDVKNATKYADRVILLEDGKIIEDKKSVMTDENFAISEFKNKKSKSSKHLIFYNIKERLLIKKKRLATFAVSSIITATLLGILSSIGFNNKFDLLAKSMSKIGNNNVVVEQARLTTEEDDQTFIGFNDAIIENIKNNIGVDYLTEIHTQFYGSDMPNVNFTDNNFYRNLNGSILIDENFLSKYDFQLIGDFPNKDNEVAISDYYFYLLNKYGYISSDNSLVNISTYEDIIGKEICFKYSYDDNVEELKLNITGIIDTDSISNFEKLMTKNKNVENDFNYYIKDTLACSLFLPQSFFNVHKGTTENYYSSWENYFNQDSNFNLQNGENTSFLKVIIDGDTNLDANECLVPASYFSRNMQLSKFFDIYGSDYCEDFATEAMEENDIKSSYDDFCLMYEKSLKENNYFDTYLNKTQDEVLSYIFSKRYISLTESVKNLRCDGSLTGIKIVGFYLNIDNNNFSSSASNLVTKETIQNFYNKFKINYKEYCGIAIPLKENNLSYNSKILSKIDIAYSYNLNENEIVNLYYENISLKSYDDYCSFFEFGLKIIKYIFILLTAINFLFSFYYISGTLNENKKEIAIYLSLGMKSRENLRQYIVSNLIVSIFSLLISAIISLISITIIDKIFMHNGAIISYLSFNIWSYLIVFICFIIITLISTIIAYWNLRKKSVLQLIKE